MKPTSQIGADVLSGEWWEVLGVDEDADPENVKSAYRQLARLYHPDINNNSTNKDSMQAINRAYQEFQQQLDKIQNLTPYPCP